MSDTLTEISFFDQRIKEEMGVSEEMNKIHLFAIHPDEKRKMSFDANIFSEDQDGNIRIMVWTLDRQTIEIDSPDADPYGVTIANGRQKTWYITRYKEPKTITKKDGTVEIVKYHIPKGAGTFPFLTPGLIEKYENKTKIKTLVLTEGYFKAFKGYMHGLDIVGLSSITHFRQKDTQQMYSDVLKIIKECQVENIIMLYDGDCLNISTSALEKGHDLYTRPVTFFKSACAISDLFKDYNLSVYWAMVNSQEIAGQPKGLDDVMIAERGKEAEVAEDLVSISRPGTWFRRINISTNTVRLHKEFNLKSPQAFYNMHADVIGEREFIFNGTKYKYDREKGEVEILMPGAAKNYFRVGDIYYEFVKVPNQYNQLELYFHKRKKDTIVEDHGKNFIKHVAKYKAFCNVPDNVNYQQVIHNCFNVFHPFQHQPEEGECKRTLAFIRHIFQEHYEFGLDYIQLLLTQPTQILPILCLVSKENSTGKSTFGYYLKELFGANMCIVGNAELQDQFNGAYATKMIVCCDEAFIEKKVVIERIKMLSTAKKITMRMMQRDGEEIDFFGKFILISNNEENFIYATDEDIRYWVRKVPRITADQLDPNMMDDLVDEIPAFIHMLNNRQMSTSKTSRMWFDPKAIETEALKKVREHSRPKIEKAIEKGIKDMFIDFSEEEILMSLAEINKAFFGGRQDHNYLEKVLRDNLKVDHYKNSKGEKVVKRYSYPKWQETYRDGKCYLTRLDIESRGRPYVFTRDRWLTKEEKNIRVEDVLDASLSCDAADALPDEIMNNSTQGNLF